VNFTWVGPDYFNVIGTRVQQGRGIEDGDKPDAPRVTVINATLAKRLWPAGDALGKMLQVTGRFGSALKTPIDFQVVGVVEDAKWNALTEPARPLMYLSLFQRADSEVTLLLRTRGEPAALTSSVRQELMRVDKNVPMLSTTSLKQHIAYTLNTERTRALLSGAFGALGLLLSAAGIYGVLSYFISRRTREIGLRMALGAARGNVLGWILRHGMRLVMIGITVGLGVALLLSRALEGLLFGVHPTDPLTLAVVVAVLFAVALLAIYLPARRASGVDPMEALRME
jgi:predicted permease